MAVNRRKKNTRTRANRTRHGSHKKHRGHGSRGGSGMAGTGKRADSKKPSIWENTEYFGKYGFISGATAKPVFAINIVDIERNLNTFVADKLIAKEGDTYVIDLNKLGFQKLLGDGRATHKMKITSKFASRIAIEKIKAAGGDVTVTIAKKEKKKKEDKDNKANKKEDDKKDNPKDNNTKGENKGKEDKEQKAAPKPAKQEVKPAKAKA
jgi:large subunit ribosomal protein L15